MHIRTTNRFFLFTVIFSFAAMLIFDFLPPNWNLPELVPYLMVACISLLVMKRDGARVTDVLPYNKKINFREVLLIIALTICLYPVSNVFAQLGSYMTGDITDIVFDKMKIFEGRSFAERLFIMAVIPAVFEEMYFRGFFYSGYRKYHGARTAIILSSILFGLFHVNFQQFLYAAVLGIVIAVIRELTGSMWAGMLYHFVNNGISAILSYVEENHENVKIAIEKYGPISNLTFADTGHTIYSIVAFIISIPLILLILKSIAKGRGREDDLKNFFKNDRPEERERLVSAGLVIGILLYIMFCMLVAYAIKSGVYLEWLPNMM